MKRSPYAALLSPLRIGNTVLKNRMLFPNASPHFLQGPEEYPADGYIAFTSALARAGAAIVTVAEWNHPHDGPAEADFSHMQYFNDQKPAVQNYLSAMADEVHFYGSKLILSTQIDLPQGFSMNGGIGHGFPGMPPVETEPLPKERMGEVIEAFVRKVGLYKGLGYDGVTMRVDMSLVPDANERRDEYGGSVEGRTRLVRECYAAVKAAFGPDFITEAQIAGEQPMGYTGESAVGYPLEDAVAFAKSVEGVVDILQLREKDMAISHPTGYTFHPGEHETIRYSMAIKAAGCKILTEPIGGFFDPEELNGYIAQGKCDMIGMARAFFSNPDYLDLLEQGRGEDLRPCLWCNKCHGTILPAGKADPWISVCSVNPTFGIAHKLPRLVKPAAAPKRVAVIGGGPAGMQAAITAAERGHTVTLYEKSQTLGGQLIPAAVPDFKWPVGRFRDWLIRRLDQVGVTVKLGRAPTPSEIAADDVDVVFAATGASPTVPSSIDGLRNSDGALKPEYQTCVDFLRTPRPLGRRVVICGASETGVETAMHLARAGHEVTLLTRQTEIGHDCSKLHYVTMAWVKPHGDGTGHLAPAWEQYDNIHGITQVTTRRVEGGRVTYADAQGVEHTVEADSVLICGGVKPCVDDAMVYAGAAPKFILLGDANGDGNIQKCIRDAWSKAVNL